MNLQIGYYIITLDKPVPHSQVLSFYKLKSRQARSAATLRTICPDVPCKHSLGFEAFSAPFHFMDLWGLLVTWKPEIIEKWPSNSTCDSNIYFQKMIKWQNCSGQRNHGFSSIFTIYLLCNPDLSVFQSFRYLSYFPHPSKLGDKATAAIPKLKSPKLFSSDPITPQAVFLGAIVEHNGTVL